MKIEAHGLSVSYGPREILHGVHFEAQAGEVTIIAGPNGSGKTTLIRALSGDLPYSGMIHLNGHDIARLSPPQMARFRAVLAQETTLSFPFTVAEIVRLGLVSGDSHLLLRKHQQLRIAQALEIVDLSGFAGRFYQELSGGERQRVQLARVLCQIWDAVETDGPRWLFLDEPVSSLDIRHQLLVMDVAARFARRGGGVIAVMHDLNLTAMYGDRAVVVSQGRIAAAGPPPEVLDDALLQQVFGCSLRMGFSPKNKCFVLPQSAAGQSL